MLLAGLQYLSAYPDYGPHTVGATLHLDVMPEAQSDIYACDVETDGSKQQNFVGLAICSDLKDVYYFTKITPELKTLLTTKKLIGHSFKDDLHFLKSAGVKVPPANFYCDTMLMSYVMDPTRRKHGLKPLALEIFSHKWPDYQEMTYGYKISLADIPVEFVARYCGMDCLETFRLFLYYMRNLSDVMKRLVFKMEMPENRILFQREDLGIMVDPEYLKQLRDRLKPEMDHLEGLLIDKAIHLGFEHKLKKKTIKAVDYNPDAPGQGKSFFKLLGFDVDGCSKEDLEPYSDNPVVAVHQEFKHLAKLISTYIDPTLENPTLPILHTRFNQTVVITGRLSSSEPNLQNIPAKGQYGPLFRAMFVARPGCTLLDGDYSQMDLRTACHFSQDAVMLEAFHTGKDLHQLTAAEVYGVRLDAVTKAQRNAAKTINFGVVYGERETKLARQLHITVEEAWALLDRYFKRMSGLHKWIENTKRLAHKKGGVSTLMGRFIKYPAIYADNKYVRYEAERQCVNAVIQGSNGDIVKLADAAMAERGLIALLTVHDEFLAECSVDRTDIVRTAEMMRDCMENTVHLSVPLTAEISMGPNWDAAKNEKNRYDLVLARAA